MTETENAAGYTSDDMLSMWEFKLDGAWYRFCTDSQHPLQALKWLLERDEMDGILDDLLGEEEWSMRMMGAAEEISAVGDGDSAGVLPLDDEGRWDGTVRAALELCKESGDILLSEAWAD